MGLALRAQHSRVSHHNLRVVATAAAAAAAAPAPAATAATAAAVTAASKASAVRVALRCGPVHLRKPVPFHGPADAGVDPGP
eukprot:289803-Chlamydomonas_euryale.AAC.4